MKSASFDWADVVMWLVIGAIVISEAVLPGRAERGARDWRAMCLAGVASFRMEVHPGCASDTPACTCVAREAGR